MAEDASGVQYVHPSRAREAYFKLPYAYWLDGWNVKLDLPAKAMLLIAMSLEDGFVLPVEKAKQWYGISADTAARGLKTLADEELLTSRGVRKKAPLAPLGFSYDRRYTLGSPFGPRGPRRRRTRS